MKTRHVAFHVLKLTDHVTTGHAMSFPDIFLSSTCFRERDLVRLCSGLLETGIDHLELSGNLLPIADSKLREILSAYRGKIRFQVHNYFPPPAEPFVLNLAHPATVEQSIRHCRHAIDLCSDLGSRFYSVHAGWAFNPTPAHLGRDQTDLAAIDMAESRTTLKQACKEVAAYGSARSVGLLLENNVVAKTNCPDGKNDRNHLADPQESLALMDLFEDLGIGVLLDTGHLNVSATTLGFDREALIELLRPHIRVAQISDNDGTQDQNRPVTAGSWFWNEVPWHQLDYVSLEVTGQEPETMQAQRKLVEKMVSASLGASTLG